MPDRPIAIFSDVHSNLEALEAVLGEMDAQRLNTRICLGDTVGYGPDPAACLERVRLLGGPIILGNHDDAAASDDDLDGMSPLAETGILFARAKLSPKQLAFLRSLPLTHSMDDAKFVHASLDVPSDWNYVLSAWDAVAHFQTQKERICFCGHTHVPMVWHFNDEGDLSCWPGRGRITVPKHGKTLVNVGSVGQPRDRNPNACFVVWDKDGRWVEFHRMKYDIAETCRKVKAAGLPLRAGQRLKAGE